MRKNLENGMGLRKIGKNLIEKMVKKIKKSKYGK